MNTTNANCLLLGVRHRLSLGVQGRTLERGKLENRNLFKMNSKKLKGLLLFLSLLLSFDLCLEATANPPESSPPPPTLETLPSEFKVTTFEFTDNTVFSNTELGKILIPETDRTLASISPENPITLSFSQLLQIASQVSTYYTQKGYNTSGAIIVIPEETKTQQEGIVKIQIIEGIVEQINVTLADSDKNGRLSNYIRARLGVNPNKPLNVNRLLKSLQLLQLDPLIANITAQLSAGTTQGKSVLNVSYRPSDSFNTSILLDNGRNPSIGDFERAISFEENNLTGLGDTIRIAYYNTDGSNRVETSYEVPFTPENSTFKFTYNYIDNSIIESPFNDIDGDGNSPDITSNYNSYDFTFNQPVIRSIHNQTYQEFNVGLTASYKETQSFLFGEPFPFAISADVFGNTSLFVLRLNQEYTRQSPQDVFAVRSEFNIGLDAFGSSVNVTPEGVDTVADSRFFAWRGQVQYVKLLAPDSIFLVRSNLQVSDRPLLPLEQFSIGGLDSVRGYRQDQLLTDNGFFLSTEVRIPLVRIARGEGVLQIIPFVDYGVGWNTDTPNPSPNNLASVGLGLQYRQNRFSARIDWGIPLVHISGEKGTWQENGVYFTIQYTPF